MNEKWRDRGNLIKASLILTIIASVLSFSVMIAYASQKTIIVSEESEEKETYLYGYDNLEWAIDTKNLSEEKAAALKVFVPSDTPMSDISMSVRYDRKTVSVRIKDTRESYFLSDPPRGNYKHVDVARGIFDGKDTMIVFELDEACTCEMERKGRALELTITPVSEIKRPIVMIDPGHGGAQSGTRVGDIVEKNITLSLAEKVRALAEDKGFTVLLTREDDEALTTEERIKAIKAVSPDYFVGIHLSTDVDDVKKFGMSASYNSLYYHNGLENAEFADMILKSAAVSASNKALGINEAGDEEAVLKVLDMPAMYLYAGFLSNTDEARLLNNSEYLNKIAQGIVDALETAVGSYTK
ncbi:N-acetylmuramoyl-L-alanine amidase [Lachnospiraceae bacterium YSD2013]|nr:N-acetylmuramoyl-L-alanine amidase [Lachnospiraceae bacterium YSD2013]